MSRSTAMEITHYFVLLALAEEDLHGYAITGQITADSVGGVYLSPSTRYFVLKSLEESGLIELHPGIAMRASRKTYRITQEGQHKLAATARMHEWAARLAKDRLGLR